jgi:hypothetical protein
VSCKIPRDPGPLGDPLFHANVVMISQCAGRIIEDSAKMSELVFSDDRNPMVKLAPSQCLRGLHQSPERLSNTTRDGEAEEGGEQERHHGRYRHSQKNSPLRLLNIRDGLRPLFADLAVDVPDQIRHARFQLPDLDGQA